MALNKRKVLEAARKFAHKGAKAKALKEYNKLLKVDPRDAKLLLEVGDAYRRWGQNEEAIAQYGKVAQQYRQDGFDARAVAVFKQILNLDPKNYGAYVSLSELYQRMGLDSEAVGALQTAADGYHKEGRKAEALDLLRQMAALDPTNTTSRLKVAELLRQEGMEAEALSEYDAVVEELTNQQDRDQLITVLERVLEIKPDAISALTNLIQTLMAAGELGRAEPLAVRALNVSAEPAQYDTLIDLYAQMGDEGKLADTTRGLAKLYRDRGDEDKARELMQRLPVEDVGSSSRLAVDVSEVAEPVLADEELLADEEPFLSDAESPDAAFGESSDLDLGMDLSDDELIEDVSGIDSVAEEEPLPEGDPDQLLAEATVYLRYDKREQAIASLRGVIAQVPEHRAALEKLGEAYASDGQNSEAVRVWALAAEQMRVSGEADAFGVLKDRIAALDPAVAEQLGVVEPDAAPVESDPLLVPANDLSTPAMVLDLDVEVDLDLDRAIEEVSSSETQSGLDFGAGSDDFEIDLDEDSLTFDSRLADESAAASTPISSSPLIDETAPNFGLGEGSDDLEFEIEPDDPLLDDYSSGLPSGSGADAAAGQLEPSESASQHSETSAGQSIMTLAKIGEELEEASFYVGQRMFDEAEGILRRVLEIAPGHPAAMLSLGEIEAARGNEPGQVVQSPVADDAPAAIAFDVTARLDSESPIASDPLAQESSDAQLGDASGDVVFEFDHNDDDADDGDEVAFEIDVDFDDGEEEDDLADAAAGVVDVQVADDSLDGFGDDTEGVSFDAEEGTEPALSLDTTGNIAADEPSAAESEAELDENSSTDLSLGSVDVDFDTEADTETAANEGLDPEEEVAVDADAETGTDAIREPVDAGETFDLREALADVLAEDVAPPADANGESGVLSTIGDGFESIFSDFKRGVSDTLDEGDFDTRYDLGIAYREMGLYEDAIGEFRVCLDSAARRFDSLYLMGLCACDLSRYDDAVNHLEQALAMPDLPENRMAGVYFDLSIAEEGAGDPQRACATMRRVLELDPDFPGAADRLSVLEAGETSSPELGEPGEVFESFDELFEEDGDDDGDAGIINAPPAEAFESFDDLVSEAEVALGDRDLMPQQDVSTDEEVESAETAESNFAEDTQTRKKSGRKKISFV